MLLIMAIFFTWQIYRQLNDSKKFYHNGINWAYTKWNKVLLMFFKTLEQMYVCVLITVDLLTTMFTSLCCCVLLFLYWYTPMCLK